MSLTAHQEPALAAIVKAAAPAAPPATVATATLYGIPVPMLIQWITLAYLVVIFCHALWKWHREASTPARSAG